MTMAEAATASGPQITIAPGDARHHSLVYGTWLNAFLMLSDFAKPIARDVYFPAQHDRIERLLRRSKLEVAIPEGASAPTCVGYCVTEGPILHWIYVKGMWRRAGVASALLAGRRLEQFSHWTYDWDHMARKVPHLKYNPYAAETNP